MSQKSMTNNKPRSKKSLKFIKGGSKKKIASKGKKSFKKIEKGGMLTSLGELASNVGARLVASPAVASASGKLQTSLAEAKAAAKLAKEQLDEKAQVAYQKKIDDKEIQRELKIKRSQMFNDSKKGITGSTLNTYLTQDSDASKNFKELIKDKDRDQFLKEISIDTQVEKPDTNNCLSREEENEIVRLIEKYLPLIKKIHPLKNPVLRQALKTAIEDFKIMISRNELTGEVVTNDAFDFLKTLACPKIITSEFTYDKALEEIEDEIETKIKSLEEQLKSLNFAEEPEKFSALTQEIRRLFALRESKKVAPETTSADTLS